MAVASLTAGHVLSLLLHLGTTIPALAGAISLGRSKSKRLEDTGEGGCLRCTTTSPSPPGLAEGGPQCQGDVQGHAVCARRSPGCSHRAAASPSSASHLHGQWG